MFNRTFQLKGPYFTLILISCLVIFFRLTACKDKGEAENGVAPVYNRGTIDSGMVVAQVDSPIGVLTVPAFYTLSLDTQTLAALLTETGGQRPKKLIFQVIDSSSSSAAFELIAYGTRNNSIRVTGPRGLKILPMAPTTFTGPVILANQELTVKAIKDILFLTGGGPINRSRLRPLKFTPFKDGNNYLFYVVTELGDDAGDGSGNTNPSPPAPPCTSACEEN